MYDLCKQQIHSTSDCTIITRYLDQEPFEDHGVNCVMIEYRNHCRCNLDRTDHIHIYVDFDNEDGSVDLDMDLDVLVNPIIENLEIDQDDCRRLADRMDAKGIYFLLEDSEEFSDFVNFAFRYC